MNAKINAPIIVEAMRKKNWGVQMTCAMCGINHVTLGKILNGHFPKRIDAWYRLINGLELSEREALIAGTHQTARLYLLPDRRRDPQVA